MENQKSVKLKIGNSIILPTFHILWKCGSDMMKRNIDDVSG